MDEQNFDPTRGTQQSGADPTPPKAIAATASSPSRATGALSGRGGSPSDSHLLPRFIRAEANLLRLPLFALDTKRLKTLDGIQSQGTATRDGQTHQFTLRATRNAATLYPGPLARAAHLAFLSIATERGLPLTNPIDWSWRDLCRRMGVVCGGQMVRHLRAAIKSTALLGIESQYAIYAKAAKELLCTRQDVLHVYERVSFVGSTLPDGTRADRNYLWLAGWYLDNLNAMFTAPVDYDLWRTLDQRSTIASRLYEFLLLNFFSGTPVLRMNYSTLAQYLPVRPERYPSLAKKQFSTALALLTSHGVIDGAEWSIGKGGALQLSMRRGSRLATAAGGQRLLLPLLGAESANLPAVEVKELRNLCGPEWKVVAEFHRLWTGTEAARPTRRELAEAAELLSEHGESKVRTLLPLLVEALRKGWPEAKTFSACRRYLPEAFAAYEKGERRKERTERERVGEETDREREERQLAEQARLTSIWEALPESQREDIRRRVLAGQPTALAKFPVLVERLCLEELRKDEGSGHSAGAA